uniref:Uncharacterized protein n=1 Tax=Populus trichocarpa TaxID=3694 RepID=A0A3N7G7D9_POPTR
MAHVKYKMAPIIHLKRGSYDMKDHLRSCL